MKKQKPIRVITLFSGFDTQCLGLKYAGIPYECVRWCDNDPQAILARNLIFPDEKDRNLGDITKVDWEALATEVGEIDLLTYSFPCQSISSAGQQAGLTEGSGTASSLLWYVEGAIKALKPKRLLLENVKDLVGKKFKSEFLRWVQIVNSYGYNTNWKVLDAQDFDSPQHRERVYAVSERLDVITAPFQFPDAMPLKTKLVDLLEEEVPEKYYLSEESIKKFMAHTVLHKDRGNGFKFKPLDPHDVNGAGADEIAGTVRAHGLGSYSDQHVID